MKEIDLPLQPQDAKCPTFIKTQVTQSVLCLCRSAFQPQLVLRERRSHWFQYQSHCCFRDISAPEDVSVGNADAAQRHEIAQYRQGNGEVVHTQLLLFLGAGGLWGTVGLCEESCVCHRVWNLVLGCVRQLADMASSAVLGSFRRFLAEPVEQTALSV